MNRATRTGIGRDGGGSVVYVVGTFPLVTTTFIDREISALRVLGVDVSTDAEEDHNQAQGEEPEVCLHGTCLSSSW